MEIDIKSYEDYCEFMLNKNSELFNSFTNEDKRELYNQFMQMAQGSKEDVKKNVLNFYAQNKQDGSRIIKKTAFAGIASFLISFLFIYLMFSSAVNAVIFGILLLISSAMCFVNTKISLQTLKGLRAMKKLSKK